MPLGVGHISSEGGTEPGRALVAVETAREGRVGRAGPRPSAMFLAQLIAIAQRSPQTRCLRRAEPADASVAYAAAAAPPIHIGRALRRSL
jgi:hypothetical protein